MGLEAREITQQGQLEEFYCFFGVFGWCFRNHPCLGAMSVFSGRVFCLGCTPSPRMQMKVSVAPETNTQQSGGGIVAFYGTCRRRGQRKRA